MEDEEPQEYNEGHQIEGLDRCHTLLVLMEELLQDHPAVLLAGGADKLDKAAESIADLYQMIGAID